MTTTTINQEDVFLVCPGRSVLTAKRGMAHAGGKITLADINTEDPAETMADFLKTGRVVVDEDAREAREVAAAAKALALKEQKAAGAKRAATAADAPVTQEDIIAAIGKLDTGNTEHWTTSGAPQVAAIEGILGKQISAADRNGAWEAMNP